MQVLAGLAIGEHADSAALSIAIALWAPIASVIISACTIAFKLSNRLIRMLGPQGRQAFANWLVPKLETALQKTVSKRAPTEQTAASKLLHSFETQRALEAEITAWVLRSASNEPGDELIRSLESMILRWQGFNTMLGSWIDQIGDAIEEHRGSLKKEASELGTAAIQTALQDVMARSSAQYIRRLQYIKKVLYTVSFLCIAPLIVLLL